MNTKIITGSNSLYIEDAKQSNAVLYTVDGATEQQTYTGKNLLNYVDNYRPSDSGLTTVLNEDGSLTTTGTTTTTYRQILNYDIINQLEDSATYVISQETPSQDLYIQVNARKNDGTYDYYSNYNRASTSFTVDKSTHTNYYIVIQTNYVWSSSKTITNKYQLEKGSTATPFERYVGGTPSPNPSYPQDIETIPSIINLFDIDNLTFKQGYYTGAGTWDDADNNGTLEFTSVLPNTTYTFSINRQIRGLMVVEFNNSTYIKRTDVVTNISNRTFTTSGTTNKIAVFFNFDTVTTVTRDMIESWKPQLEEGIVAHEYVPYGHYVKIKVNGKNLFNKDNVEVGNGYINGNNGNFVSGNLNKCILTYMPIETGRTYTLAYSGLQRIVYYKDDKTFLNADNNITSPYTFTTPTNAKYIRISGSLSLFDLSTIQLEEGSTVTSYEPCKENNTFIDLTKENLFDGELELGGYEAGVKDNRTDRYRCKNKIKVQPNTTYTFSLNGKGQQYVYQQYGVNENYLSESDTRTGTFTTSSNCYYITFRCFIADYTSSYASLDVKLLEGTSPTPYYELCKIGDYKDTLSINDNGQVVINKNIQKIILNGAENWYYRNVKNNNYMFATPTTLENYSTNYISDYFTTNTAAYSTSTVGSYVFNSELRIRFPNSVINSSNIDSLKNWLSNHNISLYQVMSTPQTITLSNTTLPLFESINHITLVDDLETSTSLVYENDISPSDRAALLDGTATIETEIEIVCDELYNKDNVEMNKFYDANGNINTSSTNWGIIQIPVGKNKTYLLSGNNKNNTTAQIVLLKADKTVLSVVGGYSTVHTINTDENTYYIGLSVADYGGTADLNTISLKQQLILNQNNSVISWNHEDFRYVKDEGWIGQFIARQVTGELKNLSDDFSITDKEFILWLGVRTNNNTNWYSLGNFLVTKVTDDEVNDKTSFEALDYTKKFNKIYEDTITYPCTALELAQNVCTQCGVELATLNFKNYNYNITGNAFTNNESCRDVMKAIGKLAFSWVRVDWNNKVYIDFDPSSFTSDSVTLDTYNTISNNKYYTLETQKEKFGVVNRIIIGYSNIEGERTKIEDATSIQENGLCEITVFDNPLVYTQGQRESIINSASDLLGLSYTPLNVQTVGHPWLKGNELVRVNDMENVSHDTIPFDRTIQYFGHIKTLINSSTPTKTNTDLAYTPEMTKQLAKTEIIVDKQNKTITSIVQEIGDRSDKQTTITQDIDGIASQVQDIPTITTEASGTGTLHLTNLLNMRLIELKIHPTDSDILGLFASTQLKVAVGLKALSRGIHIDGDENNYYLIPDNLYFLGNVYDEFIYNSTEQTIKVIHRIGIENGQKYVLDEPVIEEFEYRDIIVGDGNYNVFMSSYPTAYIYIKAMIKNDYTTNFATSYELNSKITQTANEINLEVNKKVDNTAFNSMINQTASSIGLTVEQFNNGDKVSSATILSQINNDESSTEIKADKISLAGKTIQMTSDNIAINSTNFKVDKDGNITANNATLNSGTFKGNVNTSQDCIVGDDLYVGQNQSSDYAYRKAIIFSNKTNVRRSVVGSNEALSLTGSFVNLQSEEGISGSYMVGSSNYSGFHVSNDNFQINCNQMNTSIDGDSNGIYFSHQPSWPSDKRLKQNIENIDTSWIDELKVKEFEYIKTPDKKQIGLIAQDYEDKEYAKYFLNQDKEGYYSIAYGNITNALIKYCQEMKKEINSLKEEIKELKESDK